MRVTLCMLVALAVACLATTGCIYKRPEIEKKYEKVKIGMHKDQVVKILKKPTMILANEMYYLYDDPERPVRLRFVLNDKGFVTQRYYESKADLAKKAADAEAALPPVEPLSTEEKEKPRAYPGAPLERFQPGSGPPPLK